VTAREPVCAPDQVDTDALLTGVLERLADTHLCLDWNAKLIVSVSLHDLTGVGGWQSCLVVLLQR
jgi:hypothetical protein